MDPIQRTKELVNINSVNPFTTILHEGKTIGIGNEAKMVSYLETTLRAFGYELERQVVQEELLIESHGQTIHVPARHNLLAQKGSGDQAILLFGHTDTVDVKDGWETDPFEITEKPIDGRNRLYALGANDMKSGLAAMLYAAEHFNNNKTKLKLAFLVDEEFWSFGAARLLESDFLDDVRLALVPEIAEVNVPGDTQWLGLGRLGRTEFQFQIRGAACHGADAFVHPTAVNAVHESIRLQSLLLDYCRKIRRDFRSGDIEVTNSAYLSWQEGGRPILSVPEHASFVFDRSFLPNEEPEAELSTLQGIIKDGKANGILDTRAHFEVEQRKRPTVPCRPYFFAPQEPAVQFVEGIVKQFSKHVLHGIGRSVADENRIAERGIPTVIVSPQGGGSHTSAEWVDAASIERIANVMSAVCNSEKLEGVMKK